MVWVKLRGPAAVKARELAAIDKITAKRIEDIKRWRAKSIVAINEKYKKALLAAQLKPSKKITVRS